MSAILYQRYKALTIAVGAAIVLDAPIDDVAIAVLELERDAGGTACEEPAAKLRSLVERARTGEVSDGEVDEVRASHRSLRREMWVSQPCEYVPCCAGAAHDHR